MPKIKTNSKFHRTSARKSTFRTQKDTEKVNFRCMAEKKDFFVWQFYMFIIWRFSNLEKAVEVGKPISNEKSLQFWHNEEFSSLYFTFIDRKQIFFIILIMEGDTTNSSMVYLWLNFYIVNFDRFYNFHNAGNKSLGIRIW